MHKKITRFIGCVGIVCLVFFAFSCSGVNKKSIKRMQLLEEGVDSPTKIEELKTAIAKYEKRVEDVVTAQESIGIWYKMLATRYLEEKMYGEALEALEKAIHFYPTDKKLFYYVGVSGGYMAKAQLDFRATGGKEGHDRYLLLAESGYKRAIELDPRYSKALYGLGVLYAFEMNEPGKAIPILQTLLTIETKNYDAMFVLARALFMSYDFDGAIAVYDDIIGGSASKEKKAEAEANKKVVLDEQFR